MGNSERVALHKMGVMARMAREFYRRGWMWGTSGNLSVLLQKEPRTFAITASGVSKGELTEDDLVIVEASSVDPLEVKPVADGHKKPSAESSIHAAIYQRVPRVGAVFHVHTISSTLVSERQPEAEGFGYLKVAGLEMLKGWGVWDGDEVKVPIFHNWPDAERIADDVSGYLKTAPQAPVLLVRGHGVTAWGKDLEQAKNHLEVAEFLFQVLWQRQLKSKDFS